MSRSIYVCLLLVACGSPAGEPGGDAGSATFEPVDLAPPDALASDAAIDSSTTPPSRKLWIAFAPDATQRDLAGLFACLLDHTQLNDYAKTYPKGYAIALGGVKTLGRACGSADSPDYACAVADAQFPVGDLDVVLVIYKSWCGGSNRARPDDVYAGGVHIRAAEAGDGTLDGYLPCQERVAVHEVFESIADWAAADCCTGETPSYPAGGPCVDCPASCGQYQSDRYGGYDLVCAGKTWLSQRVSPFVPGGAYGNGEFDPNNCKPFTVTH